MRQEIVMLEVTVFVSHYIQHGNYYSKNDLSKDIYLGHRVIQALESAQWLNMISAGTDLTLYCGDFNTDPSTVSYRLLRSIVPLKDSWAEYTGDICGGETSDKDENTFSTNGKEAKRIDYIMYQAGPGLKAETLNCWLPLPNRVPETSYSYSDHEAVAAVIKLSKPNGIPSRQSFYRSMGLNNQKQIFEAVNDAIEIINKSLKLVEGEQTTYIVYISVLMLLLLLTFIPSGFTIQSYCLFWDLGLFFPRFAINVIICIFFLMGSLFNRREKNALVATKKELQLIADQFLPNDNL